MKKQFLESHLNLRVFVYKNLHKNCWSARDMKTGLIAFHCDSIIIKDAKFKVSKKGRQRVLKDRVKNVHAGVMGTTLIVNQDQDVWTNRVRYNPYETDTFINASDNSTADACKYVYLSRTGSVFTSEELYICDKIYYKRIKEN